MESNSENIQFATLRPQTSFTVTSYPLPYTEPASSPAVRIQFTHRLQHRWLTATTATAAGGLRQYYDTSDTMRESFDQSMFAPDDAAAIYGAVSAALSRLVVWASLDQETRDAFLQRVVRKGRRVVGNNRGLKAEILTTTDHVLVGIRQRENAVIELLEKEGEEVVEGDGVSCVICLGELPRGTPAMRLPCSHSFHNDCIRRWLLECSHYCPVCRYVVATAS